jgi:predicted membrane chloride channel (bestrophin family)
MKTVRNTDLGVSDKGHSMMTLFMAFLVISRVNISLSRYNESRGYLGKMDLEARELVQNMVTFTQADQSDKAKQWRHDMAYDISILLRLAMAVIDYPSHKVPCWQVPELRGKTKEYVMKNIAISRSISTKGDAEMTMRVPIQMAQCIRDELFQVNNSVDPSISKVDPWQYTKLFGSVDSFMVAYYGMRKFLTTPFPFPLVQMARTVMFIYLFSLPFALLNLADSAWVHGIIVFLVTYGFVGLETVSIELDDPFGEDDNDFDNLGMIHVSLFTRIVSIDPFSNQARALQ